LQLDLLAILAHFSADSSRIQTLSHFHRFPLINQTLHPRKHLEDSLEGI
jgi:hypothetical protein